MDIKIFLIFSHFPSFTQNRALLTESQSGRAEGDLLSPRITDKLLEVAPPLALSQT